jgi:hypothetical protein
MPRARLAWLGALAGALIFYSGVNAALATPGLWQDAAAAAALQPLRSEVSPILMGNAIAVMRAEQTRGFPLQFAAFEAVLTFLGIDRYDLFKASYAAMRTQGGGDNSIDGSMGALVATADALESQYGARLTRPKAGDPHDWLTALPGAAMYFASAAIQLRSQITPRDRDGLAEALVNRGLTLKEIDETPRAIGDYREALRLLDVDRVDDLALAEADEAFSTMPPGGARPRGASASSKYFTTSAIASYVPIAIVTGVAESAPAAIQEKQKDAAAANLDVIGRAQAQGEQINSFLLATWPCHPQLAKLHFWRAAVSWLRRQTEMAFGEAPATDAAKAVEITKQEFVAAMVIALHASGPDDREFRTAFETYQRFLVEEGHADEADATARIVADLSRTKLGGEAPQPWRASFSCVAARQSGSP